MKKTVRDESDTRLVQMAREIQTLIADVTCDCKARWVEDWVEDVDGYRCGEYQCLLCGRLLI